MRASRIVYGSSITCSTAPSRSSGIVFSSEKASRAPGLMMCVGGVGEKGEVEKEVEEETREGVNEYGKKVEG